MHIQYSERKYIQDSGCEISINHHGNNKKGSNVIHHEIDNECT